MYMQSIRIIFSLQPVCLNTHTHTLFSLSCMYISPFGTNSSTLKTLFDISSTKAHKERTRSIYTIEGGGSMDPCPFVRIVIANLALKFPTSASKSTGLISKIHPSTDSSYCKIKFKGFTTQLATIPLVLLENHSIENKVYACFTLKKSDFEKLVEKSRGQPCLLTIETYAGRKGCGFKGGKLLGSVVMGLDLKGYVESGSNSRSYVLQNGWVVVGKSGKAKRDASEAAKLHVNVRAESDPRFVFQFDGEPECSPQVFQVNGNVKQPVFTCKFSFRNSGDQRNLRSRSSLSEPSTSTSCFASFKTDEEQEVKERKGWSITIHDLSGSPVAAASMVTPFVPSQGTDRVSRSNPGAWLILRPAQGTWKPWGRLEAWRERNGGDHLGYRFEHIPDGSIDAITLANSTISTKNGGKVSIDITTGATPVTSPSSSFDFGSGSGSGSDFGSASGSGSWAHLLYRGFVMSSTVEGDGKFSKPEVEVGVQHVSCTEDAAAFVALAAAMDLSMDACKSFSQELRKELRQPEEK